MKKILLLGLIVLFPFFPNAQENEIEKLLEQLKNAKDHRSKITIVKKLASMDEKAQKVLLGLLKIQTQSTRAARRAGRSKDFAVTRKKPGYKKRHALIIGIDNYTGPGIQDLDGPGFDAAEVVSVLALRYGFEYITLLIDKAPDNSIPLPQKSVNQIIVPEVNRKVIVDALQSIQASNQDALFFYYAGHGMPGHIVASDSDVDKPKTMLSYKEIAQFLAMRHAHHTLMVLDCCYSGSILNEKYAVREMIDLPDPKLYVAGKDNFLRVFNRRAFQVITAGAGDEEVGDIVKSGVYLTKERDRGHSPFTAVLLNALRGLTGRADGKQIASELGFYLSYTLINEKGFESEKQAPRYRSLAGDGDFTFFPAYKVLNPKLVTPLYMTGKSYADLRASSCEALFRFIDEEIVREYLEKRGKKKIEQLPKKLRKRIEKQQESLARSAVSHVIRLLDAEEQKKTRREALVFIEKLGRRYGEYQEFGQAVAALKNIFLTYEEEKHLAANCLGYLYYHSDSDLVKLMRKYAQELLQIWEKGKGDSLPDDKELHDYIARLQVPLASAKNQTEEMRYWGEQQRIRYWLATEGLSRVSKHRENLKVVRERAKAALKRSDEAFEKQEWDKCGAYAGYALEKIKNMPGTEDLQKRAKDNVFLSLRRYPLIWKTPDKNGAMVKKMLFSPDGKILATNGNLWDCATGQLLHSFYVEEGAAIQFSSDAKIFAAGGRDSIRLWDSVTGKKIQQFNGSDQKINSIDLSPDGKILASCSGTVILWDMISGIALRHLGSGVSTVKFSPDGKILAGVSYPGIRLWDIASGKLLHNLKGNTGGNDIKFSPDGKMLLSKSNESTIRLWNVETGRLVYVFDTFEIDSLSFSPDGKWLAAASRDKTIRLWDVAKGERGHVLYGHEKTILYVCFSHDGKTIASASRGGTIRLWEVATGKQINLLKREGKQLCFSPDGKILGFVTEESKILLCYLSSGRLVSLFPDNKISIASWRFSQDENQIIVATWQHIQFWHIDSKKLLKKVEKKEGLLSPNEKILVRNGRYNALEIFDLSSDKVLFSINRHNAPVTSIAFSPDAKIVGTSSEDKTARLWDVKSGAQLCILRGHSEIVEAIRFSPDGKMVATASFDKTIRLWDIASGSLIRVIAGHEQLVASIAFSADGKTLLSSSYDKTIRLWNVASGKLMRSIPIGPQIDSAVFSRDERVIISYYLNGEIRLHDFATGKQIKVYHKNNPEIVSARLSPDGKFMISSLRNRDLQWVDLSSDKQINSSSGHNSNISSIDFSPDGRTIASASYDRTLRLWNAATGEQIAVMQGHESYINAVKFSPDGRLLASGSWDKTLRLWNAAVGKQINVFIGHKNRIMAISFSPDGKWLASASDDHSIRIWDIVTGKRIGLIKTNVGIVSSICFSPGGKTIATASFDKTARLWDVHSGKLLHTFSGHNLGVCSVDFSPCGKMLATGSEDRTVNVWHIATGKNIFTFKGHTDEVKSVSFSPSGRLIASASKDKTVRIWDIFSGRQRNVYYGHSDGISSVKFSPSGKTLVSGSHDKTLRLWQVSGEPPVQILKGDKQGIKLLKFSPDDSMIGSVDFDGTIRLWHSLSGELMHVFNRKGTRVSHIDFSPDGKKLATISRRNMLQLWDTDTGWPFQLVDSHKYHVNSVAFSPDSTMIAVACEYGEIILWDMATGQVTTITGHKGNVHSLLFLPSGILVSASEDKTIRLWDNGKPIAVWTGHGGEIDSIIVSPDNKTVASTSQDNTIRLWDIGLGKTKLVIKDQRNAKVYFSPNGKILACIAGRKIKLWDLAADRWINTLDTKKVESFYFTPDGKTMTFASNEKFLRLWDAASCKQVRVLQGHDAWINSIAISSDGKILASASTDTTIRLWDICDGKMLNSTTFSYEPRSRTLQNRYQDFSYHPRGSGGLSLEKTSEQMTRKWFSLQIAENLSWKRYYSPAVLWCKKKKKHDKSLSLLSLECLPLSDEKQRRIRCRLYLHAGNYQQAYQIADSLPAQDPLRLYAAEIIWKAGKKHLFLAEKTQNNPITVASQRQLAQKYFMLYARLKNLVPIKMSAGSKGGSYRQIGKSLQKFAPEFGIHIALQESPGALNNLTAVDKKQVDISLVQHDVFHSYLKQPKAKKSIRILTPIAYEEIHIFVREKSEINRLSDLCQKKIAIGTYQSGTRLSAATILPEQVLRTAIFDYSSTKRALDKLIAGDIDALFYTGAAPVPMFSDLKGLRLLSLKQGEIEKLTNRTGNTYYPVIISVKDYPWLKREITTIATPCYLIVGNISFRAAQSLIEMILGKQKRLAEYHEKWHKVDLSGIMKNYSAWKQFYHPALAKCLPKYQSLEEQCQKYIKHWQPEIYRLQSYYLVRKKIEEIRAEIAFSILEGKYGNELQSIIEKLRNKARQDKNQYQNISEEWKKQKLVDTFKIIAKYKKFPGHLRIMKKSLDEYVKKFEAIMTITIYLTPSENFKDTWGGAPDFRLYVTYQGKKNILYKNGVKNRKNMGTIEWTITAEMLNKQQWMHVYVVEVDLGKDDKYGNFSIDISSIFNNQSKSQGFRCGKDGNITLEVIPSISNIRKLPLFSD